MSQSRPTDAEATAYAENYVLYGDQSRAFRVAFPDSKGKPESTHQRASVFHKILNVQSRIDDLTEYRRKITEEEFNLSTIDVVRGLYVEATTNGEGSSQSARVSAWKAIGDYTGGFDANRLKAELSGPGGGAIKIESTLSEEQALQLLKKHDIT